MLVIKYLSKITAFSRKTICRRNNINKFIEVYVVGQTESSELIEVAKIYIYLQ